jgi:hypothetical protein
MSEWSDSHIRTQSGHLDLGSLRDAVAAKAGQVEGEGWWACVEYFDDVRILRPTQVIEDLNENTSGLTLAWPGGNLRADRLTGGEFWVTEVELAKGTANGARPCKTRSGRALVWGKAQGPGESGMRFGEGRVKPFDLPVEAPAGVSAHVETTRVAVKDDHGVYREHATILGQIVPGTGGKE